MSWFSFRPQRTPNQGTTELLQHLELLQKLLQQDPHHGEVQSTVSIGPDGVKERGIQPFLRGFGQFLWQFCYSGQKHRVKKVSHEFKVGKNMEKPNSSWGTTRSLTTNSRWKPWGNLEDLKSIKIHHGSSWAILIVEMYWQSSGIPSIREALRNCVSPR